MQDAWLLLRTGLVSKKNETKGKVIWPIPPWTMNRHLKANQKEKLPWKNPSKCASPAPDGAVSALSGDPQTYAGKAKPIAEWMRRGVMDAIGELYFTRFIRGTYLLKLKRKEARHEKDIGNHLGADFFCYTFLWLCRSRDAKGSRTCTN
jgi:hypothetical protein